MTCVHGYENPDYCERCNAESNVDVPRCDVCGTELVLAEDQQGHDVLGCPLCHAKRQAQVWRGEWEKVCRELAAARALLREVYAKAVRNKHNLNWHEVTLTNDQMAAILRAAGGGE